MFIVQRNGPIILLTKDNESHVNLESNVAPLSCYSTLQMIKMRLPKVKGLKSRVSGALITSLQAPVTSFQDL